MAILAIDQGTTGTTTVLFDRDGRPVARAYREIRQIYPQPGWVEHDPLDIQAGIESSIREILEQAPEPIDAVGITNQRETTVLWDARSGRPVANAIVWQCRRTAEACERLRDREDWVRARTGLPLDPYFSATKLRWLLDHAEIPAGAELRFGTVDAWIIWNLTGGAVHATDPTNAGRTLLYNIHTRAWDPELLELFGIPAELLPEVRNSAGFFGEIARPAPLRGVPILGVAGDQQAALFGQACFTPGTLKNTYGTGCFLLLNTGAAAVDSAHGLLTTLAVDGRGRPAYALEGAVFIAGAAIQWLRDELGLIATAAESEECARRVADSAGVHLVPAFVGLGAPYWDMRARGILTGLTRGAGRDHIVRAALEAIAFQTADVVRAMEADTGRPVETLAVDGGAAANDFLMQFQADILGIPVTRPRYIETTSQGAAWLAGLEAGVWKNAETLAGLRRTDAAFQPAIDEPERRRRLEGWRRAVRQARTQ